MSGLITQPAPSLRTSTRATLKSSTGAWYSSTFLLASCTTGRSSYKMEEDPQSGIFQFLLSHLVTVGGHFVR